MIITQGLQVRALNEAPTAAGVKEYDGSIQSDSMLVTLFATSVTGTLDVAVYATTDDIGEEALLFSFPQLSAATTNLLLRRSSITTARFRIRVTYSNACAYEVHIRAVSAASSDTRILGQDSLRSSTATIGTTPALLVPSALVDRAGLIIRNYSSNTLFIAENGTVGTAGYPLLSNEAISMDLSAGVELWAVASAAGTDVRMLEAGA